mgnify:CR=1 FL=1
MIVRCAIKSVKYHMPELRNAAKSLGCTGTISCRVAGSPAKGGREREMNIVVAYRRSKLAMKMIDKAVEHAKNFKGSIFLVTSVQQVSTQKDAAAVKDAREVLEQAKKVVEKQGIPCETELIFPGTSAGFDVLEFARKKKADEIIVGVQNKSKVGKFIMGSTAQDIVLNADCPVITIKS